MGSSLDNSTMEDAHMVFILAGVIFIAGKTWLDVFILTVNWRDWRKKKRLSTTDRILTLQGLIRISLGFASMIWSILVKYHPRVTQVRYVSKAAMFSIWYFIACNVWLTTSLCSYYCVKIADFRNPFFLHLKRRLSGLASTWLLGSALLSLASSLPILCSDFGAEDHRNSSVFLPNKNVTDVRHTVTPLCERVWLLVGYGVALSICASSALLLLFSLWRHHRRMLGSWDGHRSPQTSAHFQALITILSLLVNNVLVSISIQLQLSGNLDGDWISRVGASLLLYACFSVESLITVWGNKKFKNEFRASFCFAKSGGRAS